MSHPSVSFLHHIIPSSANNDLSATHLLPMSVPPPARSSSPSTEDHSDDELDRLMRDPTPDVDDNATSPPASDPLSEPTTTNSEPRSPQIIAFQNDRSYARSLANKARLHPYQRQAAEDIVGVCSRHSS